MHQDDKRFERFENKLDQVVDRIGSIDTTLSEQHIILREHIRRTELLESAVQPIVKRDNMVYGGLKLLGAVSAIVLFTYEVVEIVRYMKGG